MNLNSLKKFAQGARRKLLAEVASRLDYVLGHDDAYVRSHQGEIGEIRRQLERKSREQLVEEVAYTWFNRIVALRYMDLRGYHKVRIVSPRAGQVQPELLFQIKQGRTPKELQPLQPQFDKHLNGTVQSSQPDREIYTTALLGICNNYSRTLPFLFRQVDAYMAVLLPTDLLSESSILSAVNGAIGEEDVADVEVIGWLYQFYISEKKDQVFGRPKGEKIKKEDIPAATQLFTPHWIVRYMVENSLGRLWRNNRPDTAIAEQMEYYIEGDPEPEYLTIAGPEEITLLDPACGSGHILTYAFDLLYGMYEEAGYSAEEIPSLILTNNLYGIDIDTRAAELASFALTMKAREKDRFFFKRGVVPRVVAMEDVSVDLREAGITMSPHLQEAFGYLTEATNFGSLIPVPAEVQGEIEDILAELDAKDDADLFADQAMAQVSSGLRQLGYLARRYHCVVTNPPYMSTSNANPKLKDLVKKEYEEGKADLFAAFIVRGLRIARKRGYLGMITQHAWMFLQSYESLRSVVISSHQIESLLHLGSGAFETIGGEVVQVVAFVIANQNQPVRPAICSRLVESKHKSADALLNSNIYSVLQIEFNKIPGSPLAYWIAKSVFRAYERCTLLGNACFVGMGMRTGDNDRFVRFWFEVSYDRIVFSATTPQQTTNSRKHWVPYQSGGTSRKWYGNCEKIVYWHNNGEAIKKSTIEKYPSLDWDNLGWKITNEEQYFRPGVTWSAVSSETAFRYYETGYIFSNAGQSLIPDEQNTGKILGFLNSRVVEYLRPMLSPKIGLEAGYVAKLPYCTEPSQIALATKCIDIAKWDWDSRELSWSFRKPEVLRLKNGSASIASAPHNDGKAPLKQPDSEPRTIASAVEAYFHLARGRLEYLRSLEEDNNRHFIQHFDLEDTLGPEVSLSEITILQEEIDGKSRESGQIALDLSELVRQFVSYGVGCIFGRYSLDKDGLILANAGDDLDAYLSQIPEPILRPDESGILPITDDNDFADDLPCQWRAFLRAAFGDQYYEENLRFLEDGLGKRLRQYFRKGFYDDHLKRYKKRPIYWLITSPRGTLQALIYLHRYNRDTVNRFLNDYLRPYQQKLEAKRVSAEHVLTGGGSSHSDKTKAQKRIDEIRKALEELSTWERDVVRPLAEKRIELDLDDGVKVNYGKLGAILAKVKGLNA